MRNGQKSLPFIYGIKKLKKHYEEGGREIFAPLVDDIIEAILQLDFAPQQVRLSDKNHYHKIFPKEERFISEREQQLRYVIYILVMEQIALTDAEIELFELYLLGLVNIEDFARKGARNELIREIKRTTHKDKSKAIKELRKEKKVRTSIEESIMQDRAVEDASKAVSDTARKIANTTARIGLLKTVDVALKRERIRKETKKILREVMGVRNVGLNDISEEYAEYNYEYLDNKGVEYVRWVVNAPQDAPCLMPAGEVQVLGEPFSNGYTSPQVHKFCQCVLVPARIDNGFVDKLLGSFGL